MRLIIYISSAKRLTFKLFIFWILFFLSSIVFGQESRVVKGIVYDHQTSEPLPYSTIVIKQSDSILCGTITDKAGTFQLEFKYSVNSTPLSLSASFIGYKTSKTDIDSNLNTYEISLHSENINLDEVVIQGQKRAITQKNGKIHIRVLGSYLEQETTMEGLLTRLPGMVIRDNMILDVLKGTPLYYINGRKVTNTTEVFNIDISHISDITIDRHPSAEHDSKVGVIVYITTNQKKNDMFFTFNSIVEQNASLSEGGNINIGKNFGKSFLSLGVGYKYNSRKPSSVGNIKVFDDTPTGSEISSFQFGSKTIHSITQPLNTSLTFETNLGDKTFWGFRYDLDLNWKNVLENDSTHYNNYLEGSVNSVYTEQNFSEKRNRHSFNTYFTHQFNHQKISFYGDLLIWRNNRNQSYNQLYNQDDSPVFTTLTPASYQIWSLSPRYQFNKIDKIKGEIGVEFTETRGTTKVLYTDPNDLNTHNNTKERLIATFGSFSHEINNVLNYTIGLRFEHSKNRYSYGTIQEPEQINIQSNRWLPSFALNLQKHSLSYRAGITYPDFVHLSAYTYYTNEYMVQKGNPRLKPEIWHEVEFSSRFFNSLLVNVGYRFAKKSFANSYEVNEEKNQITSSIMNLKQKITPYAMIYYSQKYRSWIPAVSLFYQQDFVSSPEIHDETTRPNFYFNLDNQLLLKRDWSIQLSYNYNSKAVYNYFTIYDKHLLGLKVTKSILNKQLLMSVQINDILDQNHQKYYGSVRNIMIRQNEIRDSRGVVLRLIYRFNKSRNYQGRTINEDYLNRL